MSDTAMVTGGGAASGEFARGWRVMTASFIGMGASIVSLAFYSGGIWVRPWQEEFGWTRGEIGLASGFSTIALALAAPFAGKLIDVFGLRRIASLSLLLFGFGLYSVSLMNGALWQYYALVVAYTLVGVASSPLAFTRAINAWFVRNRGLALGISLTSTGVAGVLLPRFLTPYVAEHGWRAGFEVLALAAIAAAPIVYFWISDHPPNADGAAREKPDYAGASFSEAVRSRAFWTTAFVFLLVAIAVAGLIPAFIPLLQDGGMNPVEAGGYGAVIGAAVIVGRFTTGFLLDRLFAAHVASAAFAIVAVGLLALAIGKLPFAMIGAVALGLGIGCEVDLIGYFTARYFGLRNYGAIYGVLYSTFQIGCGVSPFIVGLIWDVTGAYDAALIGAAALLAMASVTSLTLPRFSRAAGDESV